MLLPSVVGPRVLPVLKPFRDTIVVYSDASCEPDRAQAAKIRLLILDPAKSYPIGYAAVVSESELRHLRARCQQITAREMLPPLYALVDSPATFSNRDIIWFIDNQASCSCLVRGSSGQPDPAAIAGAIRLKAAVLSSRLWIEWASSESNPSDGLSRDGIEDQWSQRQGWQSFVWEVPPLLEVVCTSLVQFAKRLHS